MGRYLKSFNEANITDEFLSELKDFCEMNLVYLMDDGLQVSVDRHPVSHLSSVTLRYPLAPGTFGLLVKKDWNDIKDHLIPFFTRLNNEYNVITFDQLPIAQFFKNPNNKDQVQFVIRRNLVNNRLADQTDIQTGYRKNFKLNDVISDKLDLGNNLIVEIKFYVSCIAKHSLYSQSNDKLDVIPVKGSRVGSRVKRFLGFNESDFYVRLKGDDLQVELDDVCDMFLLPLKDDGFTYEVRPAWNGEFDIRLSFTDGSTVNKFFDYTDVMDRFIPLVRMLSRRYNISEWIHFYSSVEWDINKKVFSVEQICVDKKPDYMITTVKLTVKGRKQVKLQEGLDNDLQVELEDLCDTCLSPLVDDGFTYEVTPTWNGEFVIRLNKNGMLYDYTEVMDRFIPLVRILSTRYNMFKFIYFYSTEQFDINKKVFTVDQICNDKKPDFLVNTVKLTVESRK